MPRFTLRELLLATPLIGAGVAGLYYTFGVAPFATFYNPAAWIEIVVGSSAAIGAGIGTFFHRKAIGGLLLGGLSLTVTYLACLWFNGC